MMHTSSLVIGRASDQALTHRLSAVEMRALHRITALRREQVERHGHTPERDAAAPPSHLPLEARDYINAALEDLHFGKGPARARVRLEKAAALLLAAIARIQIEERS